MSHIVNFIYSGTLLQSYGNCLAQVGNVLLSHFISLAAASCASTFPKAVKVHENTSNAHSTTPKYCAGGYRYVCTVVVGETLVKYHIIVT